MSKYFENLTTEINLSHNLGSNLIVSDEFMNLSANLISQCTFIQYIIQSIIYTTHGSDLLEVKKKLKNFPNPKSRLDFIRNFPYKNDDNRIVEVFDFSRSIFNEVYQVRNVLAHEIWSSSNEYPGAVIFSSLDEHSKIMMATSRLWHDENTTPNYIFDATVRFIRQVKIMRVNHLRVALKNCGICSFALMSINNILNSDNQKDKDEFIKALMVFRGTSHIFQNKKFVPSAVEHSIMKSKKIN